jgi:hypothetical protein
VEREDGPEALNPSFDNLSFLINFLEFNSYIDLIDKHVALVSTKYIIV